MKKLLVFSFLGLFLVHSISGQLTREEKKKYLSAQDLMANGRYSGAEKIFNEFWQKDKENIEYNFYTGLCQLYTDNYDNAIQHFDFIINAYSKTKVVTDYTKSAIFYKAKALHNLYQFDEERELLNTLNAFELNDIEKGELEHTLKGIEYAQNLFFDFKPLIVTRLDILNSEYDDHTPIPTANGEILYFTSKRPGGISGDNLSDEGKYYEDIWMWKEGQEPVNIGSVINTKEHEATGGLSLDGNTIFIYKASNKKLGDLYESKKVNGEWSKPVKLNKNINVKNSTERHASLSPDGKRLYFSSDRSGGKGGRDIWVSELIEDGTWGKPVNLNINTRFDEESPYMLEDGKTLYFSSKGYNGMGGYDIYKSTSLDGLNFSEPVNIGFPVNTVEDDVFFFPLSGEKEGYFTRRKTDNADIFKAEFPDNTFIVESDVNGKEYDKEPSPIMETEIEVIGINSDNEVSDFTLKVGKGKYKTVLIPDNNFKFYYSTEGYVFDTENIYSEEVVENGTIQKFPVLIKIESGKTEKYKLTPFEENKADLTAFTSTELDLIVENLNKYPELVVNFSTEPYLSESSQLSKDRKTSAVQYLIEKGIPDERIFNDLSCHDIPTDFLEYTIYDIQSIEKAIQKKDSVTKVNVPVYYTVEIDNIYFKFDKTDLFVIPTEKIATLSDYLKKNPDAVVGIVGYTDAVGSPDYNDKLAMKRANLVKDMLIKDGVKDLQIKTFAYGEDNPVSLNKKDNVYYEPSKKFNRRIEFIVLKQGTPLLNVVQFKDLPEEFKDKSYNKDYKRP
jgi:outer membrane protein OmpA-like peptidoglycan-associated protein/tetratricopeptide (TPR) repeat protein